MSGLKIETRQSDGRAVIHLRGSLDATTSPDLEHVARALQDSEIQHLALDCRDLSCVTSAGLKLILAVYLGFRERGSLRIVTASGDAEAVLRGVGLDRLLPFAPTLPADWSEPHGTQLT
ncbi:MAG: STAS domain-containing protein [Thiotrichales bacterium]